MPKTDLEVKLTGEDGNAFNILGKVTQALKEGGYSDLIEKYEERATSGDYNNLLRITMDYVNIIW